ncbi:hypothetical protein [Providencia phage PSTRCR_127]|nr:hypothetical protein [Providencia phage PSTRCR_127]
MILIGLTGQKRSGKDTCADAILEISNGKKKSFAQLLKWTLTVNWPQNVGETLYFEDFDGHGFDREKRLQISDNKLVLRTYFISCVEYLRKNYGLKGYFNFNHIINKYEDWTIRRLLQTLGTDIVVQMDKMFWVKHVVCNYIDSFDKEVYIITDCRQTHEIETVRNLGGTIIHLRKPGINNDTHITEQELPVKEGDIILNNDSDLETFIKKVQNEYSRIRSIKNSTEQP